MKLEKEQIHYVIPAFVFCYVIQACRSNGASIIEAIYKTSFPFLVDAGIAYIVNIVMSLHGIFYIYVIKNRVLLKARRAISMILVYLTFTLLISQLFSIVLPDLISSINSSPKIDTTGITNSIREVSNNKAIRELSDYFGNSSDTTPTLSDYSRQILNQVLFALTGVLTLVSTIVSTILSVFISLVSSTYVLVSKEQLERQFNLLIDTCLGEYAEKVYYVLSIPHQCFHGFFAGQILEAMILGSSTTVGVFLFGLPYAATIGVLVVFMALVPTIGAYIGATTGFTLVATQSVSQAFLFLVYLIILQQFEGNVIYPHVVGGSIGPSGIWVLMVITTGGALWGILGMLAAVPLTVSPY